MVQVVGTCHHRDRHGSDRAVCEARDPAGDVPGFRPAAGLKIKFGAIRRVDLPVYEVQPRVRVSCKVIKFPWAARAEASLSSACRRQMPQLAAADEKTLFTRSRLKKNRFEGLSSEPHLHRDRATSARDRATSA